MLRNLSVLIGSAFRSTATENVDAPVPPRPPAESDGDPSLAPRDHAVKFALEMLAPSDFDFPASRLLPAYRRWCADKDLVPFSGLEFGTALLDLLVKSGIETREINGQPRILGARIRYFPAPMPKQNRTSVQRTN